METNEIKYIPMYKSYIDAVAKLPAQDRVIIYEAIFEYGFTGKEPEFDNPYLQMGWELVKPNLVNNINNMLKQSKNGKNGGRPKKNVESVTNNSAVDETATQPTENNISKPEPKPYPNLEEEETLIPNDSKFDAKQILIDICDYPEAKAKVVIEQIDKYSDKYMINHYTITDLIDSLKHTDFRKLLTNTDLFIDWSDINKLTDFEKNTVNEPELEYN